MPPGSTGDVQWGPALAALDADGDGLSNGFELNDALGNWTPGDPPPGNLGDVTDPGTADLPAPGGLPGLSLPAVGFLGGLLSGLGVWGIRGRFGRSLASGKPGRRTRDRF